MAPSKSSREASAPPIDPVASDRIARAALTINDVARAAGMSKSTVSNVINGRGRTSASTRATVMATMEAIGYRPNAVARSLRAQRTDVIGVVVGDLADGSNAELASQIERFAADAGYAVLLVSSDVAPLTEVRRVHTLVDHRAAAIIFIAFSGSAAAVEAVPGSTPVVFASERSHHGLYVAVDDDRGVELAVMHLANLGHRRIGYVSQAHPEQQIDLVRYGAFERALATVGVTPRKRSVLRIGLDGGPVDEGSRQALLERYLARSTRPTSVFASSDRMAFEVMAAAEALGLSVPEDLSVVGWGNTAMARSRLIALTSVAQPNDVLAQLAVGLATTGTEPGRGSEVLEPWLEVRRSTAAPAAP